MPGRAAADRGPRRPRGPDARARPPPREGAPRAPLVRAGLRRLVVLAAQRTRCRPSSPRASATSPARCGCASRRRARARWWGAAARWRSTTTAWRPTTPPTRSGTPTPRASCACGVSVWRRGRPRPGPGAADGQREQEWVGMTLWEGRISTGHGRRRGGVHGQPSLRPGAGPRRPGRLAGPRARGSARWASWPTSEVTPLLDALDMVEEEFAAGVFAFAPGDEDVHTADRAPGHRAGRRRRAPSCTPGGAATTRSPPRCGCGAGAPWSAWPRRSWPSRTRWPSAPARPPTSTCPGYTHMQRAQPVLLAHHLLAHGWALARDVDRLLTTVDRLNMSPLGAGALAGSSLPLDPDYVAAELGFHGRFENSLDAVSDRDFVAEALFDLALLGVHLSRMGEEIVLWSTEEFGFCTLDDAYATGSSMLPQKKNPDVAELARGKSGRLIGHLTGGAGHPQGAAAGLQPRPAGGQGAALRRRRPGLAGRSSRCGASTRRRRGTRSACRRAADGPAAAAIDLAEMLVEQGMPFRQAHALVGGLVRESLERHVPLVELVAAHPGSGGGRGRAARARCGGDPPADPGRRRTRPGGRAGGALRPAARGRPDPAGPVAPLGTAGLSRGRTRAAGGGRCGPTWRIRSPAGERIDEDSAETVVLPRRRCAHTWEQGGARAHRIPTDGEQRHMQRMSGIDPMFVYSDTPETPMEIAYACVFDPATADGRLLLRACPGACSRTRMPTLPPFRRRLVPVPLGLDHPRWVDDPDFDLGDHLHRAALPHPGGESGVHRPGGQGDGPAARSPTNPPGRCTSSRVWPAAGSGSSPRSTTPSSTVSPAPSCWPSCSTSPPRAAPSPGPARPGSRPGCPRSTRLVTDALPSFFHSPVRAVRGPSARSAGPRCGWPAARSTSDTGPVSDPARRAARPSSRPWGPGGRSPSPRWTWRRCAPLKDRFGSTINDVVLAVCSGALRSHLAAHGLGTDSPLVAVVPVSVRGRRDGPTPPATSSRPCSSRWPTTARHRWSGCAR